MGISLLRIATTTLDPEAVLQPFLETGEIPVTDLEGNEIQSTVTTISDQIASFDLKYFDFLQGLTHYVLPFKKKKGQYREICFIVKSENSNIGMIVFFQLLTDVGNFLLQCCFVP